MSDHLLHRFPSAVLVVAALVMSAFLRVGYADQNTAVPQILTTIPIAVGAGSFSVAVNKRTNRVYVSNLGASTVSVIDGERDVLIDTIPIVSSQSYAPNGAGPTQVAIDEQANVLYVLTNNGTISVVDGKTDKVLDNFIVDSDGGGFESLTTVYMVRSRKTGKLYVQNDNYRIDVVDPQRRQVVKYIYDDQAGPLAIDQRTNRIYASNAWNGTVWVIDGNTDEVTDVISGVGVAASPADCYLTGNCDVWASFLFGMAVDESLGHLYVGAEDGRLVTIDTRTHRILHVEMLAGSQNIVAVNSKNHSVYSLDSWDATLAAWDGKHNRLLGQGIAVGNPVTDSTMGDMPQGFAVNPVTGKIYVADFGDFLDPNSSSKVVVLSSDRKE